MTIKVAINGFGRIGRNVFRALYESGKQNKFEVVAVNDLGDANTNAHLLQYDTAHGRFSQPVTVEEDHFWSGRLGFECSRSAIPPSFPGVNLESMWSWSARGFSPARKKLVHILRQVLVKSLSPHRVAKMLMRLWSTE